MTETAIVQRTVLLCSAIPGVRLWRNNSGAGYGVSMVRSVMGHLMGGRYAEALQLLRCSRPVVYGVAGQGDLSGILPDGRRLEVELKTDTGRQSDQQKLFQEMIEAHHGVYVLARSPEEAETRIEAVIHVS